MDANRRWLKVFVALGCLVGSLLACYNPTPTAEPSSSPAPEPTETPEQAVASPVPEEPTSAPSPTAEDATLAPEPIVSPEVEGFVIAYTKGGSLWLSEDGAAPRQLTSGGLDGRPILSPDGQWVVFEREAGVGAMGLPRFDLWVVGVDGSDLHRLVAVADLPGETVTASDSDDEILLDRVPMQVAWLPGSNALAFNTQLMVEHGMAPKDDLWRVGVDSQGLTQVLPDGQGGVFAFSPDGAHLAVSTPSEVSMMNADGGNRRALVDFDFVDTASEYAFYPMPAWAPDGSSALVAISSPEPFSDAIPTADVWRLPVDGAALQLATLSGTFLFSAMGDSLWSADRTRVGYTVAAEVWSNERTLV
ncbi:MAG: hypothetical protein GX601_20605, partial [Anaerolineales bacterium]|nr:hypothetical protein [Anaerolineales bacterium]